MNTTIQVTDIDDLDLDDDIARRHAEAARLEQEERTRAKKEEQRLEKLRTEIAKTGLDESVSSRLVREQLEAEQDKRDEAEREIEEAKQRAIDAEAAKAHAAARARFERARTAHVEAVQRAALDLYQCFDALRSLVAEGGFRVSGDESTSATAHALAVARKTVPHDVAFDLFQAFAQSKWH